VLKNKFNFTSAVIRSIDLLVTSVSAWNFLWLQLYIYIYIGWAEKQ